MKNSDISSKNKINKQKQPLFLQFQMIPLKSIVKRKHLFLGNKSFKSLTIPGSPEEWESSTFSDKFYSSLENYA